MTTSHEPGTRKPRQEKSRHITPKQYLALAGIVIGGVFGLKLVGNSETGNAPYTPVSAALTLDLGGKAIQMGTNIRFSPNVGEDSAGSSNRCSRAQEIIPLSGAAKLDTNDPANGPWVGLPLKALPEQVQEDCARDSDDTVWVSQQYVNQQR